ncbi:uncharacterized protein LOC117331827 [Pecten maximus]|uniref:uncharacterized protein LOC117331827 n=1 Tax=Pecten maximus TaxID=6579 RepID=UPI0014588725|nr:uncharacterized protein LOC117331827 [Pecten maximus]
MIVVVYLLCVIGSTWAQNGLNNLQFRTFETPASATQLQRSAQQFRIPTSFPTGFRSSRMPSTQNSPFVRRVMGSNPSGIDRSSLLNSNGLLMMFPSQSGQLTPGLTFNRPAPLSSVLNGPTLPIIPPNLRQFSRGRGNVGFNFGQHFARSNQNHPTMLGSHLTNRVIPRRGNVPQTGTSSSQSSRPPASSDQTTQRIIDFILRGRSQNTNQQPIQQASQANSIAGRAQQSQSQPKVPQQTGLTGNAANTDVSQASSNFRFRTKTDEEIRQEVQERMRQLNQFLAKNPTTRSHRLQNTIINQNLPSGARQHFNNVNRRLQRLDSNTLNNRVEEAFKNRDKSGKTPLVVDGGFTQEVMPTIVIDGGVSWRNQGVLFDQHQRPTPVNLETNKELAQLFPVPP